ncbi:MAG TPA: ABC transporter permease [Fimbriimonas sp.]|nr:ABC transporter permease [Fimbriimonas sp.]
MALTEAVEEKRKRVTSSSTATIRVWPLSPFVYLSRNSGKTIPLIGVIFMAVMLVSSIIALIDSIPFSVRSIYQYSKVMLGVSPRGDPSETPKILAEIRKTAPVPIERIMLCRVSSAQVDSIVGKFPFPMIGLSRPDMQYYLQKLHVNHIEGRLPTPGEPEALVSTPVAKNLDLHIYNPNEPHKLRDKSIVLSPDKQDSYSPRYVKVVGIADTPYWVMVNPIEYQRAYHFPPIDLGLVYAKNQKDQDTLGMWGVKHFEKRHAQLFAYYQIEKQTKTMFKTLYTILDVVTAALAVMITLMMAMLMNIYQSQRLIEFGLLQAVGYTRGQLLRRVFWESAIVVAAGWLLGVGGAQALLAIANAVLTAPRAFQIDSFDPVAFKYTAPLPIAILVVAGLTVWWRFHRFDPVSIVERRLV